MTEFQKCLKESLKKQKKTPKENLKVFQDEFGEKMSKGYPVKSIKIPGIINEFIPIGYSEQNPEEIPKGITG